MVFLMFLILCLLSVSIHGFLFDFDVDMSFHLNSNVSSTFQGTFLPSIHQCRRYYCFDDLEVECLQYICN